MSTSVDTPHKPFALFMLPPPLLFGLAFGLGALLQAWWPIPPAHPQGAALFYAGGVILALAVGAGALLVSNFLQRRTTLNPFGAPAVFIERGPYRFSRNPMYVAIVVAYVGGMLMFGSAWPLLTLLAPIVILNNVVIPFEETSMVARFGQSYRDYCARVRRWI